MEDEEQTPSEKRLRDRAPSPVFLAESNWVIRFGKKFPNSKISSAAAAAVHAARIKFMSFPWPRKIGYVEGKLERLAHKSYRKEPELKVKRSSVATLVYDEPEELQSSQRGPENGLRWATAERRRPASAGRDRRRVPTLRKL